MLITHHFDCQLFMCVSLIEFAFGFGIDQENIESLLDLSALAQQNRNIQIFNKMNDSA